MPDLLEEIENLKTQIAESEGVEEKEPEEEIEEEVVEEPVKEEPEPVKEEVKEPEKPKEEELDASGYARLRRELAAKTREVEALKAQPKAEAVENEQPQIELPPVLLEIVKDYQFNMAGAEFNNLEAQFRRVAPDYDDVSNAFKADLYHSVRIQNPRWADDQVLRETNRQLLTKAGTYAKDGLDPIQEMYEDAKALGYKAKPKEQPKAEVKEEVKPDLDRVAANKNRNSGMTGASGGRGGQPQMTLETAASIPPNEWAKLPAAEKRRLLGQS